MDHYWHLRMATATDKGLVRTHNEDAVFADPQYALAILADGMGGYNAGEVASSMAIHHLSQGLVSGIDQYSDLAQINPHTGRTQAAQLFYEEIALANQKIYQTGQSSKEYQGMGTTLVMALLYEYRICVGHVGDSRLYRLRHGELVVLTRDHSIIQEQLDLGIITPAEARTSLARNLVTRAVGIEPTVEPEIREYQTEADDLYLFCSDGLCDMLEESEIAALLRPASADLQVTVADLVAAANARGGKDNISVILIHLEAEASLPQKLWKKIVQHNIR